MDGSRYRSGRTRRLWLSGAVTSVLALVALLFVNAAGATLSGSSFDTTNGSLTDTSLHDWNPPGSPAGNVGPLQAITCPATAPGAGTNCGLDLTGSSSDDSFSMGPKEDDAAPAVGTGSIPPNKDDLSRFYVNQEKAGGNDYLYLAWERTNTLGSAHLDFEFNQSNTASANGVTKLRTAGDMLVTFDFGGSGVPTLSLSRWVTSGAATQCEVPADGVPCWGALVNPAREPQDAERKHVEERIHIVDVWRGGHQPDRRGRLLAERVPAFRRGGPEEPLVGPVVHLDAEGLHRADSGEHQQLRRDQDHQAHRPAWRQPELQLHVEHS